MAWATPDADVNLPDYPSRRWRQTRYSELVPRLRCDGILAVARAVQAGWPWAWHHTFCWPASPGSWT